MYALGGLERPVPEKWKQWSVKRDKRKSFNGERGVVTGSGVTTFYHVHCELQSRERARLVKSKLAQRGRESSNTWWKREVDKSQC